MASGAAGGSPPTAGTATHAWIEKLLNDPVGATLVENQLFSASYIVAPRSWPRADIEPRMRWASVKFEKANRATVPEEPGLYAFVSRIPYDGLPPHGWVMYVGQAGDGSSENTLRKRFMSYFHHKEHSSKRAKIFWFLNLFDGHLEFFFTPLPDRKHQLEALETQLLGAFRPPFTDRTYPATAMSPSHAF